MAKPLVTPSLANEEAEMSIVWSQIPTSPLLVADGVIVATAVIILLLIVVVIAVSKKKAVHDCRNCDRCGRPFRYEVIYERDWKPPSWCDYCWAEYENTREQVKKDLITYNRAHPKQCYRCQGTGQIKRYKCLKCNGTGRLVQRVEDGDITEVMRQRGWKRIEQFRYTE